MCDHRIPTTYVSPDTPFSTLNNESSIQLQVGQISLQVVKSGALQASQAECIGSCTTGNPVSQLNVCGLSSVVLLYCVVFCWQVLLAPPPPPRPPLWSPLHRSSMYRLQDFLHVMQPTLRALSCLSSSLHGLFARFQPVSSEQLVVFSATHQVEECVLQCRTSTIAPVHAT